MTNVTKLFGNNDPRIDTMVRDLKDMIYERSSGVFTLATVLGILQIVAHDLVKDMENADG